MLHSFSGPTILGLVAAGLYALVPQASAQTEPATTTSPIVVQGELGPVTDLKAVSFLINPTDAAINATAIGQQTPSLIERESASFSVEDGQFFASLDPSDVPSAYMTADGLVSMDVVLSTDDSQYTTSVSARAVAVGTESSDWVDPVVSDAWARENGKTEVDGHVVPVSTQADVDEPETEDDGLVAAPPLEVGGDTPPAGCTYTKIDEDTRSTTIGTTYPVGGDVASMIVSNSTGAEYGIATAIKDPSGSWGEFRAGSSKFAQSGWGFSWQAIANSRSYRIGVKYALIQLSCVRGCDKCSKSWKPTGETSGGVGSNKGITRPDWGNCVGVDPGTWWRNNKEGSAYNYGGAVKFAGAIGIDLSISRNYNGSQKIYYKLEVRRRLCGNNATPGQAGKIMERQPA